MDKRGIVIMTPFSFDGTALELRGPIDPVSLRQYLLYWDKIDWPDNNMFSFGTGGQTSNICNPLESLTVQESTFVPLMATSDLPCFLHS